MTADTLNPNDEPITADTLRAQLTTETQRDKDARQASYFSTSSELAAYDIDAVKEVFRKAR